MKFRSTLGPAALAVALAAGGMLSGAPAAQAPPGLDILGHRCYDGYTSQADGSTTMFVPKIEDYTQDNGSIDYVSYEQDVDGYFAD